jgi:hypothetical protein
MSSIKNFCSLEQLSNYVTTLNCLCNPGLSELYVSGIALITYQGYNVAQKITVSVKVSTQLAQSQLSRSW